jgi:hypothetical protein
MFSLISSKSGPSLDGKICKFTMDRPNPLFQRRPSFEERAEALQCLCDGFAKFLGYGGWPISVLRKRPEDIPYDCSRLAVIDDTSIPAVVSTYWRFPDPGYPIESGSYQDLPSFIRDCFKDDIDRAARRSPITVPGFPPAPGEDFQQAAERYFQALEAESKALKEEIDALLATPELLELERIIWS